MHFLLIVLKEINPEYSLEGMMLKLELQYFRVDSLGKTMMLGKIKGKKRRGRQRMRWLDSIADSIDMNLSKVWEILTTEEPGSAVVHGVTSQTRLND